MGIGTCTYLIFVKCYVDLAPVTLSHKELGYIEQTSLLDFAL